MTTVTASWTVRTARRWTRRECQDLDGDTCDDCSVVQPPDTANDGLDTDGDGACDAADTDDDGDGYSDADETTNCSPTSDPLNAASTPTDTDDDGSCDTLGHG